MRGDEAFRRTLRIALVMALGLTVAEARDQPFAFLSALFAVQLLVKSPNVPSLAQGVGFAIIMAVSCAIDSASPHWSRCVYVRTSPLRLSMGFCGSVVSCPSFRAS